MPKRGVAMVLAAAFLALPAGAQELGGVYTLEGAGPEGKGAYSGAVEVVPTGDTARVVWTIAGETHFGTGILYNRMFAVNFIAGDWGGIALYELLSDGSLQGLWTEDGGDWIGTEVWRPAQ